MKALSESDSKQLRKSLHTLLRTWSSLSLKSIEALDYFLIFRQSSLISPWLDPLEKRRKFNQFLENCIAELEKSRPRLASLLSARFIEGQTILFLAHRLNLSQDQINRRQREAIELLAQIIEVREFSARNQLAWQVRINLSLSPDFQWLARDSLLEQLIACLRRREPPYIIALTGLGGIGKTALAQLAVQQLAESRGFSAFEWVNMEEEMGAKTRAFTGTLSNQIADMLFQNHYTENAAADKMSRSLAESLKIEPRLIVIDGLNSRQSDVLLRYVHRWANPSKFLLIGRARFDNSSNLLHFPLPELNNAEAAEFLQNHIFGGVAHEEIALLDSQVLEIVALTGGNPRALKLVAEMLRILPLRIVSEAFAEGSDPKIETLYRNIYQPVWRLLSPESQQLLARLPNEAANEISYDRLRKFSGLEEPPLRRAVNQLVVHSLLEVCGSIEFPRYCVSRLTLTFMGTKLPATY